MEETFDIGERLLVMFDGHCGLCNGLVRWLLRRDRRDRLRFVAMESAKVAGLVARHVRDSDVPASGPGTLLVVQDAGGPAERVLERSDAVLTVLRELPRPWPELGMALRWIPRPVRDLGYRVVARLRYRIWGRLESCPIPTAEERARFL
ncbi:MAG: DCC1-like thiol-disulfide oxidoreductase family protein [Terracidiphilus sp.]